MRVRVQRLHEDHLVLGHNKLVPAAFQKLPQAKFVVNTSEDFGVGLAIFSAVVERHENLRALLKKNQAFAS